MERENLCGKIEADTRESLLETDLRAKAFTHGRMVESI